MCPILAGHSQLFLQSLQLFYADVVTTTHNHHHWSQLLRQLILLLQTRNDIAVDGCKSSTTCRFNKNLFIICKYKIILRLVMAGAKYVLQKRTSLDQDTILFQKEL